MLSEKEIQEVISSKMGDPRKKLSNNSLWETLLKQLFPISERLYQAFRGLRACNAQLDIKDDTLSFMFPSDFNEEFKDLIKQKYIKPYANLIKEAMKKTVAIEKTKNTGFSKRIPV